MKMLARGCFISLMCLLPMQSGFAEQEQAAPVAGLEWGPQKESIALSLAGKKEYSTSEVVSVTLRLRNVGSKSYGRPNQEFPYSAQWYDFSVIGPDKQKVPLTLYGKHVLTWGELPGGFMGTAFLEAGHDVVEKMPLNRLYDMTMDGVYSITVSTGVNNMHRVPPGAKYTEDGSIIWPAGTVKPKPIFLTSNVLEINIREATSSEEEEQQQPPSSP